MQKVLSQNLKMNMYDLITIMLLTAIISIMVYENDIVQKIVEYIKDILD